MKFYESGKLPRMPNMYFIYGDGGTGKTSLFKQFPGKKFLFSFDQSTNVIKPDDQMDTAIVEEADFPTIQATVSKWLQRAINSHKYDAIALDNMTSLQNLVLENIDNASKDGRQNYQKLQLWFRQLGTMLRNSGVTIYATAHQIDNGASGIGENGRFEADMNAKTFNAFTASFDLVGRLYKKEGQRMIDLDPEQGNHAKNRLDDRTLIKADELLNQNPTTNEKEGN
ncbi:AAA family ATPase [Lacticaseibacillus paracasei]|uniref:AAA family ATPase n=1 Tax=Lacticaseibacillus paracasei TaxID=1597 RepID=UPI000F0B3D20|nr:AAA family ATPase [Lacticaseibacillus paracasei]RNE21632.1 phage nucleotide-binding protein [Lacticaseibacillus paracasei]TLQ36994.1 nucleotide-binding protein [Lacticaseibacillus paracasei]